MGRLLSAVLVCFGFGAFFSVAHADHSWGSYHWGRTANPFTLKLGDNVSSAWDNFLVTAANDWTGSSVLNLSLDAGGTTADPRKCRPTIGRVEVCSASYGGAWLGVAQIWISGGHIYQATTKVNNFYLLKEGSKYNTPAWRRLVMCQEIGHTFGLDHQDENFSNANLGTCMDYTSNPAGPPSNEHPNAHDWDQLETIYNGHTDNTTSATQASARNVPPPAMNEIDFEGPGQWGKLVRSTHAGRLELYELDFGGGHKIFTFVIWADEEDRGRGKPR
jgi:hypothetical protein